MAGQKANTATAYEAAFSISIGTETPNTESWQSEYDLTLALYLRSSRAAYLQGRFNGDEQVVVLNRAKTVIDKVQVYDSRIVFVRAT